MTQTTVEEWKHFVIRICSTISYNKNWLLFLRRVWVSIVYGKIWSSSRQFSKEYWEVLAITTLALDGFVSEMERVRFLACVRTVRAIFPWLKYNSIFMYNSIFIYLYNFACQKSHSFDFWHAQRWCYTRRFATTIYSATQFYNFGTVLQPFETMSQQCCNSVWC